MRPKSIILLLLALGCGLVASIGISQVMENQKNHAGVDEMMPILVAVADIGAMDKFTPENIKIEEWPKDKVRNGTLNAYAQLEGKHPRSKIFAGQPILDGMLIGDHEAAGATESIPKGFVVCAVRVDPVSGSGSLIRPGDRVNVLVYLTRNTNIGINDTQTKTILQDISVFAVDTTFVGQSGDKEAAAQAKTVSLLVTLSQAEKLTLASEMGTLRLVLRSAGDTVQVDSSGATPAALFGAAEKGDPNAEHNVPDADKDKTNDALLDLLNTPKPSNTAAAKTPGFMMTVIKGDKINQIEFPSDGSMPKQLLDSGNSSGDGSSTDSSVPMPPLPGLPGASLSSGPAGGSTIDTGFSHPAAGN